MNARLKASGAVLSTARRKWVRTHGRREKNPRGFRRVFSLELLFRLNRTFLDANRHHFAGKNVLRHFKPPAYVAECAIRTSPCRNRDDADFFLRHSRPIARSHHLFADQHSSECSSCPSLRRAEIFLDFTPSWSAFRAPDPFQAFADIEAASLAAGHLRGSCRLAAPASSFSWKSRDFALSYMHAHGDQQPGRLRQNPGSKGIPSTPLSRLGSESSDRACRHGGRRLQ